MIVLTDSNGDEQLIPDSELIGLHTELRDLLQRQIAQARREQRDSACFIIDKYDGPFLTSISGEQVHELLAAIKKEIQSL